MYANSYSVFLAIQVDPVIAGYARNYLVCLLPGLLCFMAQDCFRRFLQSQGFFWPHLAANVTAALLHVCWGYLLVVVCELNEVGAGIASSLTYFTSFVLLQLIIRSKRMTNCLVPVTFKGFFTEMRTYYTYGLPTVVTFLLSAGCFEGTKYLANFLGVSSLAASIALFTVEGLVYTIPLGFSIAMSVIVGKRVGENRPQAAKNYWLSSVVLLFIVLVPGMVVFIVSCPFWASAFTTDPEVLEIIQNTVFWTALTTLFTGYDVVTGGVLRGLGKQHIATLTYFISFYLVSFPSSYFLTQVASWALPGLMVGLVIGNLLSISVNSLVALRADWKPLTFNSSS